MTFSATVKSWIAESLKAAGLRGRGAVWRVKGSEVQWVVHIDDLPNSNRLGVDIGLELHPTTTPRRPTDCPILLHLENVPVARSFAVVESLDLNSNLQADQRRHQLEDVTRALARYLADHLTLDAVRSAYRDGDLASAFIRKEARAFLEGVSD